MAVCNLGACFTYAVIIVSIYSAQSANVQQAGKSATELEKNKQYVVRLVTGVHLSLLAEYGLRIERSFPSTKGIVALVSLDSPDDINSIKLLQSDARVGFAEPSTMYSVPSPGEMSKTTTKVIEDLDSADDASECVEGCSRDHAIWGLVRVSHRDLPTYHTDPYLYDNLADDATVYIVDSGVDIAHPEFTGRAEHGFTADGVTDEGPFDLHGHGTNVASLAAGVTYGAAKLARIVSCKVLNANGSGSSIDIAETIHWVANETRDRQADAHSERAVINLSLGGLFSSQVMEEAIAEASAAGVVVVAAAGNGNVDGTLTFPSALITTISVGAIDSTDNFASFSNFGSVIDISAPGVSNLGAGSQYSSYCQGYGSNDTCLTCFSGTSMAAPYVTGALAQWLQTLKDDELLPNMYQTAREMLRSTATTGSVNLPSRKSATFDGILYLRGCHGFQVDARECQYVEALNGTLSQCVYPSTGGVATWVIVVSSVLLAVLLTLLIALICCVC